MKAHKIILINNSKYDIVSDSITLEYNSAGRAVFVIQASENFNDQLVQLYITNEFYLPEPYFTGYVEDSIQIDDKQQRIFCRELDYCLNSRAPISLRNQPLENIVKNLELKSNLTFNLLKGVWEKKVIPNFINIGCGYDAVDQIKNLAQLPELNNSEDLLPQFRINSSEVGLIDIGYKMPVILEFDPTLFFEQTMQGCSCALIPAIRPGMQLKIGTSEMKTVKLVEVAGANMRISYK